MDSDTRIRSMTKSDLAQVGGIADDTGLFPSPMLPDIAEPYLSGRAQDTWTVAVQSDEVVGFCFCEPERMTSGTWNVLAIGVRPSHQGRGIGAGLMRDVEHRLTTARQRIVIVETLGTDAYARTRRFYQQLGYVEEARIRDFYEPGGDKVIFWKHL